MRLSRHEIKRLEENNVNDDIKKTLDGVGAMAEMSYLFFKTLIIQGATISEANNLTREYMAAIFIQAKYGQIAEEG